MSYPYLLTQMARGVTTHRVYVVHTPSLLPYLYNPLSTTAITILLFPKKRKIKKKNSDLSSSSNGVHSSPNIDPRVFSMGSANLTGGTIPDLHISKIYRKKPLRQLLRPPSLRLLPPLELRRFKLLSLNRIHSSSGQIRRLGRLGHKPNQSGYGRSSSFRRR